MGSIQETDVPGEERKYHDTQSAYSLPNDNVEHQRLELQHSLFKGLMGGRIIHAPVLEGIDKAVDIGCGTGSVTHAIASAYPSASVYGVDISAVPINLHPPLENLSYVRADFNALTDPETPDERFQQGTFDYVFSRMLTYGIPDWKSYIERAVSLTRPGAWIEMQEADYHWYRIPSSSTVSPETFTPHNLTLSDLEAKTHRSEAYAATPMWARTHHALLRAKSLNPFAGSEIAAHFASAGLEDICVRRYISACGVWEGLTSEAAEFGQYVGKQTPLMYGPVMRKLGRETEWNEREVEAAVRDLEKEFDTGEGQRLWFWIYVVCGRKVESVP